MTPEQFCYWLQGYVETNSSQPSREQWEVMKEHLKTVFNKVTPNFAPIFPAYPTYNIECKNEAIC